MNWKDEATEKLSRYPYMEQAIENLPREIKRLENQARTIHCVGVAPHVQGGTSREDMLLNNLVLRQELQCALADARAWMKNTNRALSVLTEEERTVLNGLVMYPGKGALEGLCKQLGVESTSIYRRREKALRKFTLALYGTPES